MNPPSSKGPRPTAGPRRGPRSSAARSGTRASDDRPWAERSDRRRPPSRKPKPRKGLPAWGVSAVAGVLLTGALCAGLLWWWGRSPAEGEQAENIPAQGEQALDKTMYRRVDLGSSADASHAIAALEAAGLVRHPTLFRLYRAVWRPLFEAEAGVHWIREGQAPAELLALLSRSRQRPVVRVTLPEGWDSFQMAERLAASGVCDAEEFLRVVFVGPTEEGDVSGNDSPWSSFEGRLYPASYDFRLDSAPSDVVSRLVAEADKRHQATFASHQGELTRLGRELGLSPHDVVTLASVVEKEAANEAELPLVASVFLNRLRDPDFRPARVLQSDPTAAYGCKRDPALNSCRQFTGKVTPAMLRDSANAFNTYRHAGLPPTPIGNPSTRAIAAVLSAPATDYLFFVSPNGGPHRFSRTLAEHERHLR